MNALKSTSLFLILLLIGLSACNGPDRKISKIDDQLTAIEQDTSSINNTYSMRIDTTARSTFNGPLILKTNGQISLGVKNYGYGRF